MIYYANYPSKLFEHFDSPEDLRDALAIMGLIVSYVNTKTGEFYFSIRHIKEKLGIKKHRVEKILKTFTNISVIENTGKKKGHSFIYKLKTYNQEIQAKNTEDGYKNAQKISDKISDKNSDTLSIDIQGFEPNSQTEIRTKIRTQTNNELTNNEKTNNEIKNKEEEKFECVDVDFEEKEKEEEILTEIMEEEEIAPTSKSIDNELNQLIGIYPKKNGSFRRIRERYMHLRLKHGLTFTQIYEAVQSYALEMESQEIDQKYWKNLENLLDPVELDAFLFKPVIAIDKKGQKFRGEFCTGTGVIRYYLGDQLVRQVLRPHQIEQMIEENRLIFLSEGRSLENQPLEKAA